MEKFRTAVDKKIYMELARPAFRTYCFFIVCGVVGLIVALVLGSLLEYDKLAIELSILAFGMLLFIGVFSTATHFSKIKKSVADNIVIETEFSDEQIVSASYKGDKKTSEVWLRYDEILFYKESKEYVYLFQTKYAAIPLEKREGLTELLAEKGIKKKKRI